MPLIDYINKYSCVQLFSEVASIHCICLEPEVISDSFGDGVGNFSSLAL